MKKIKFTSGTLTKVDFNYYTLTLFNNDKVVYRSTETRESASELVEKHNNIKIA